ncbi:MAG: glycoside hydrolase family 78 protein [Kiritimatiellales bacterium]
MKNWKNEIICMTVLMSVYCASYGGLVPEKPVVGDGFVNPLGFHDPSPAFSWKLPAGVKTQTAYRVVAASRPELLPEQSDLWDSGKVESGQSVWVPYGGKPINSRQRVFWTVQFWDESGKPSDWSPAAHFELGLLSSKDWKAQWIRPAAAPAPEFKLIRALYRSKTDPKRSQDVTGLLQKKIKNNTLSVNVSNQELGGDPAPQQVKELAVTYQLNGKEETVALDETRQGIFPAAEEPAEKVAWLRREFPISGTVERARLYVTARGLYEIRLNGKKVGHDAFTPGWTSYNKRINTLTYDVTEQLRPGNNALGALLGTGWYAGRIGWQHNKSLFGHRPELLVQLEIVYKDGSVEKLISDEKWKATLNGPIRSSSLYDGETYDARMEMPGWDNAGFDDASWGAVEASADLGSAQIVPKAFAPVREAEVLTVREITEPEPGRFVFNMGRNMAGWAAINIPVEKDKTVTVRFAEMLNTNGTLYTENYRSAKSTDCYTAAETGRISWTPVFTFHGFQYVELSGLPAGVKPEKDWVKGIVLHSALPRTGTFESSHEKLNRLQSNIVWGQRGNFLDIPTDCPQRDERLGWTGDAQVFCPTAMFNYDCHAFWKSWLTTMRDDQLPDGRIPHVVPTAEVGGGSPGWMDAATIIPWEVYVRTGDRAVLADNYEMMKRLVDWYRSQSTNNLIPAIGGFGDWLQPYAEKQTGDTPFPLLGTAFYARSAQILADAARALDRKDDAVKYAAEASAVKKAFSLHYFDDEGNLRNAPATQTAYLLAIGMDLLPAEQKAKAAAHLTELIHAADDHLRTGFLGTPFVVQTLDQAGYTDLAFTVLFKETYPSWFYSINQGATTMWERWNSYSRKDGFGAATMNSFNHYAYGAIGQWMYERIAGLSPDPANPGYRHFFIRPATGGPLSSARAELETSYGKASSSWKKSGGRLVMDVVIPPNTTATIIFPQGKVPEVVQPGTYHFELDGIK